MNSCLISSLVTLKSRLGLEAMMCRLDLKVIMSRLGRFGPRSSSGSLYRCQGKEIQAVVVRK